ncbi:flavin reductase (DIM6/NTAB) family NADH-FMN oxidoreductase RutF [Streptacidiphilus sp. BW17]|uniref:flavin reductase family protein n=1 Tax=Streptacidiphilus sp. BW17 TaxID=3156274 RepID=UPI003511414E
MNASTPVQRVAVRAMQGLTRHQPTPGAAAEPSGRAFRRTAARFPTGVTVVTALSADGQPHGTTVNSFTTVSMDPCLVLIGLGNRSRLHDLILTGGGFAVSVLSAAQEATARRFADPARPVGAGCFADIPCERAPHSGAPVLLDAVAFFDCTVDAGHEAGDHTLLVGRVEAFGVLSDRPALTFVDGRFATGSEGSELP